MKKYVIYSLKRYIPLFVITFAVCFFLLIVSFGGTIPTQMQYYREIQSGYTYNYGFLAELSTNSGLITAAIPVVIFSILLPFFANSYRYSLQSADTFYQIGKNKKSIRWVNNIILASSFIVSFTVVFFFCVLILFFRQFQNLGRVDDVEQVNEAVELVTHYLFFNFGWYIPAYFLIVIFFILNYAISYFFITRANNLVNSIIMLIIGEGILAIGVMTPIWYSLICSGFATGEANFINEGFWIGTRTAVGVGPLAFIIYIFDGLIVDQSSMLAQQLNNLKLSDADKFGIAMSIICLLVFIALASYSIYLFIKEKESSGELAGKPVGRDKLQTIIFHIGFGLLGFWISTLQGFVGSIGYGGVDRFFSVILFISEMGFYSAAYYVIHGLLRRNFRLNKHELILMLSIIGVNLINGIAISITAIVHGSMGI